MLRADSFAGEAFVGRLAFQAPFTGQSFAHVLRESLLNSPRLAREGAASQPLLHRTSQRRIAFDLQIAAFGLLLDCRQPHPDRRGGKRPRHAVDIAKRKPQPDLSLAGRMDTELRAAQLAHRWMLDQVARNAPSADTVNEVMIGRALAARHAIAAVELAMELAGGASFYRATGLERRSTAHPVAVAQSPATALGLPTSKVF